MREHMPAGVGLGAHRPRLLALALEEARRVGLARVGQQPHDEVEQLGDAGTAARAGETDRDQVALAQRLLERRVQLAGVDVAVVQVALDEAGVDLDDLLDERTVRVGDAAEVAVAVAVVEAVDDLRAALVGQVDRQAWLAEAGLDLREQRRQVDALRVDLVDDDQAVELAFGGLRHQAQHRRLDAGGGVDDDHRGLDRLERRQRLAGEVGGAGRVDQVHAAALVPQVQHRAGQRMLHPALEGVEVADRAAALEAAGRADHAGAVQQGLGQAGLAGALRTDQGQRAYGGDAGVAGGFWAGHRDLLGWTWAGQRRVRRGQPMRPAYGIARGGTSSGYAGRGSLPAAYHGRRTGPLRGLPNPRRLP